MLFKHLYQTSLIFSKEIKSFYEDIIKNKNVFFYETKILAKYHKVYIKQDNMCLWPCEYKLILLRTKPTSHGYIIIQFLTPSTENIFLQRNYMYRMLVPICAVRTCMSSRLSKGTTGLYFIRDCGTTGL